MQNAIFPFNNSFVELPSAFYDTVTPRSFKVPELLVYNSILADELQIPDLSKESASKVFSGQHLPNGASCVAMAYAGHQFGNFVPQLGDGRALLLGELQNSQGINFDLHLKGAGPTPYSRGGDGLCPIGPALREYLVSESMNSLNIPTTRGLAVVKTGDFVERESRLPGAVITRVAESHIRVGTFEYFRFRNETENLKTLLKYAAQRSFPELDLENPDPLEFFHLVLSRQARLIAHWMGVGFIHGVMNTDNCSIAGLTIDFGPCAFIDEFKSDKVFSSIDRWGRYAYNQQPAIGLWNLSRLAECLIPLLDRPEKEAIDLLNNKLSLYEVEFYAYWTNEFMQKLGLNDSVENKSEIINAWFEYLEESQLDFTLAHRFLPRLFENEQDSFFPASLLKDKFFKLWTKALHLESIDTIKVKMRMEQKNPFFIPRNHLIEKIIQQVTLGSRELLDLFLERMKDPYSNDSTLTDQPQPDEQIAKTFCGT